MGTPSDKRKAADLSPLEEIAKNYRQALVDIKTLEAYAADLRKRLIARMGKAEVGKINGVVAFTYAKTDSYAWAKFATEHGDIADRYKVEVTKVELDKDKLLAEHGGLLEEFRTRQFLSKL